jgi:hypothetical protein
MVRHLMSEKNNHRLISKVPRDCCDIAECWRFSCTCSLQVSSWDINPEFNAFPSCICMGGGGFFLPSFLYLIRILFSREGHCIDESFHYMELDLPCKTKCSIISNRRIKTKVLTTTMDIGHESQEILEIHPPAGKQWLESKRL